MNDLGCGAGDVSMLAAESVGPSGTVFGVDRDPAILELARSRAKQAGLANVSFWEDRLETLEPAEQFDAVVGRLVLL